MKNLIVLIFLLILASCTPIPYYYDTRPYYAPPNTVIAPYGHYYQHSPYVPSWEHN
jgi:hypothetical protein